MRPVQFYISRLTDVSALNANAYNDDFNIPSTKINTTRTKQTKTAIVFLNLFGPFFSKNFHNLEQSQNGRKGQLPK